MITSLLGGIGLFLLGMTLMTEGLKTAAGAALRDLLARFTGGALPAFLSGAVLTALVQSSSATILATIGFVSAGLIGFTQSVGVIFGAAVGTTSTGWLVSFLGLKYSVSVVALPLVGVGALLRLLGRGRLSAVGLALAGFGLIFVGIDVLQTGMQALAARFELAGLHADTAAQRLLLVGIGAAMTVVMQSSSAAVATTLAALHTGTIGLGAAAALVIGQNVGTSATAALAAVGGSVPARRTAVAQIVFNAFAGVLAFLLLPLVLPQLGQLAARLVAEEAGAIAVFHTAFNVIGALVLLPFAARYAALISRLVPDRAPPLTRHLDESVHNIAAVAVEAARRTVGEIAAVAVAALRVRLAGGEPAPAELAAAAAAADQARRFLADVRTSPDEASVYARHLSVLHALDHLERLLSALGDAQPSPVIRRDDTLRLLARDLAARLGEATPAEAEAASAETAERRREHRPRILERTAAGALDPVAALEQLDAMRWIDRCAYHVWRLLHHLTGEGTPGGEREP